jgi:hypothetical protein
MNTQQLEDFEERAAILEYEAEFDQIRAEKIALELVNKEFLYKNRLFQENINNNRGN